MASSQVMAGIPSCEKNSEAETLAEIDFRLYDIEILYIIKGMCDRG
ncbi:hypothetical protein [Rouxiella badensis]|jgi:hypothetical protein|nr:hypothetical protein [Rouxiella badensis]MCC3703583.1 hypothetical protein [Rouxiella badensis]MCC3719232.1 hypothetical protein [Rouxiella badensis]MCC3728482.1 hypothetical protein [Rouxiella badensis]MCC3742484.1 hypothetical protein [Rouxiella badensis]MCC3747478.1 hypothetical protein [Rouxiella badensis]